MGCNFGIGRCEKTDLGLGFRVLHLWGGFAEFQASRSENDISGLNQLLGLTLQEILGVQEKEAGNEGTIVLLLLPIVIILLFQIL